MNIVEDGRKRRDPVGPYNDGVGIFEALRENVDLVELAGQHTELKRCGRTHRGRCPFPDHPDRTASFHVYPDGRFHCFGCGRWGDVTDLSASLRGLGSGVEAALDLAREYGVELAESDPQVQKRAQKRREQEAEYARRAKECHEALSRQDSVVKWWEGRGFGRELMGRFPLGANADATVAVIPFWRRGRVQGLIRHKLEGKPKYLYPKAQDFPGGYRPLFIPGPVRSGAYLVEGIVDALAVAALGESVVAIGGTNISREQREALVRLPGPLYVLPDADEEGQRAARKWVWDLYPKALLCPAEYGEEVSGGKDTADLFQARGEGAREILHAVSSRAVDALDLTLSEAPEGSARERYRYAREHALPLLLRLEDEGEREAALRDVT